VIVSPSLDHVLAHDGPETHVALSTSLIADGLTPLALFHRLAGDRPGAFLLESVEGGEKMGRYSFMGFDLHDRFRFANGKLESNAGFALPPSNDPLEALRVVLHAHRVVPAPDLPRFQGGLVGYLGFDCMAAFENVPLPDGPASVPDAMFMLADHVVVFDHVRNRIVAVVHASLGPDRAEAYAQAEQRLQELVRRVQEPTTPLRPWTPLPANIDALHITPNRSAEDYQNAVRQGQKAIVNGEVFQVVLSQRWTVEASVPPFELYRSLRAVNPSPYMFYLRFEDFAVVGASPEVLVRLEGDDLLVRPIAGTRPRGATDEEDKALERDLLKDEKELAEHRMLVDLGRNDVGRVGSIGSVRVEDPLHIERYAHVMHIVTDVRAKLDAEHDAFDALRACFPAGTVSGAPKIRACELIAELEPDRRGIYAGAVGYFDFAGNMDTCIAIRTLVAEPHRIHVQAGAGIVYDSVPEREHEECWNKARSALTAVSMTVDRIQRGGGV